MQTIVGLNTIVFQMKGDAIVAEDRNYLFPPDLLYPVTYLILTANVLLPLYYPSYNPQARWTSLTCNVPAAIPPSAPAVLTVHVLLPGAPCWRV